MSSSSTTRPILIAGAGPTGLMLAHCLAAYGVPFDIIDAKAGPSRDSKALVVNILSQLQLALLGRADIFGRSGVRIRRANVFFDNELRLNPVDFRWLHFPIDSLVSQPQADTERQLIDALPAHVSVRWQTRLVALESERRAARATLEDAAGRRQVSYDFVVGCEGKSSVVRRALGAELRGHDYPMHFVLGDFKLRWDRPADQAYYFVYEDTFLVIVPIGAGYWRIVVKREGEFDPRASVTSSAITHEVLQRLGPGLIEGEPTWISGAPFYMRTATALQSDRLFICGDAAHLFSPIGGTGMNTGMQDAMNLGWKLAYVQLGHCSSALLNTYAVERQPSIAQAAASADAATKLIARIETTPERVVPLLPALRRRHLLRRELPLRQAGLMFDYPPSAASRVGDSGGRLKAGSPWLGVLDLWRVVEKPPALFSTVVAFCDPDDVALRHALAALEVELHPYVDRPLALRALSPSGQPLRREHGVQPGQLDRYAHARLAATNGLLLVVRPDGVLALVGHLLERRSLLELFASWFGEGPNRRLDAAPRSGSHVDRAQ